MTRRTKRRYAHELYPHPDEREIRPLSVEVPYLYARAIGLEVWGTSWFDLDLNDKSSAQLYSMRSIAIVDAGQAALLADALLQGFAGDEAWAWAANRYSDDNSWVYERARHYGIPIAQIKPYPCGPEPDHHDHLGALKANGWCDVFRIKGPESDCPDCTEEVDE